ncbi:nitric oxide reductase activation protein NorD [Desulfosarcina sp.]|uniref:nitric oxide reductase activation protein NorD n=1 Tax=Desulfosarcina sp. TaxID=2027861 RepID=UPI003562F63D
MPTATDRTVRNLMDHLAIADPKAAHRMFDHLNGSDHPLDVHRLSPLVDEVIEALAVEVSYGRNLAEGMGRMLTGGRLVDLDRYRRLVKKAAARGPALAALFARHLVPVLACGNDRLVDRFGEATRVMLLKGTYTLKAPLETLSALIEEKDIACAHAFLDLLSITYALDTSYNRTVYLTHTLPRAVDGFTRSRRLWQIRGLARIIRVDERLADAYLQGLASGLHRLSETALNEFLDLAIQHYHHAPDQGPRFLALESRHAMDLCRAREVAVPLSAVRAELERYLQARTGLSVAICPISSLPGKQSAGDPDEPLVRCDGQTIYLPEEMDLMERRTDNTALYKLLVKLEAGAIEFGTYDLDVEKTLDTATAAPPSDVGDPVAAESDLSLFLRGFEDPILALDLFTLCEHARIARRVNRHYPGLFRRLTRVLTDPALQARTGIRIDGTWLPLYRQLVMNEEPVAVPDLKSVGQAMADRLNQATSSAADTAETSARLTKEFYPSLAGLIKSSGAPAYLPLTLPFGRRLEPDGFGPFHRPYHRRATDIRRRLSQRHLHVFRSDLRQLLVRQNGRISAADVRGLILNHPSVNAAAVDLSRLEQESLVCSHELGQPADGAGDANAFRYREWDWCMGDYLPDRVRVLERETTGLDPGFYRQTLDHFRGLVRRIRYAFELLRPEEMTILRQWPEGDAFDYRALLDYALDRKAGLIPSDRLYIKRMKRVRDVAVLLLVDQSRSTANAVDERDTMVLDVEKQAIVLLCEALQVVGDRFAIAGFSGTGPLGVDFYRIKNLDAPFDDAVKGRISAMAPQRSTRMGAAIRHATALLSPVLARVRLIIMLGDGFPNDLAYKGTYAVEDTRRAVMEARAAAIHVKAITVTAVDNGQLDRLYGSNHHTRIGNIRDLPDRLVRVYSMLTRH